MLFINISLIISNSLFWFISSLLFKLLKIIYNYTYNWGLCIVIITFLIRILIFPILNFQYISIFKMNLLKPDLDKIRFKYINNVKLQNQKIFSLYRKKKLNPFSGIICILLQIPIFLSLYNTLSNISGFHFISHFFWINDFSSKDPYYIFPLFMVLFFFITQKLSINNSLNSIEDLIQRKIVLLIPFFFALFFFWLPSGLILYYIINNIITIIQQRILFSKPIKI